MSEALRKVMAWWLRWLAYGLEYPLAPFDLTRSDEWACRMADWLRIRADYVEVRDRGET